MADGFRNYLIDKVLVQTKHLQEIMQLITTRQFSKNEFLLTKGQICGHAFFIEKGLVRFYSIDEDGKEHILQFAPENWFVGDRTSMYFSEPSNFFIDAIEDTTVVLFDRQFSEKAAEISAEFRNYNEYLLQNHIRQLQNRINLLIGANAEKRYLDFVRLYPDLMLRVPQWMVASFLGITPESLSRVRKELANKNRQKR